MKSCLRGHRDAILEVASMLSTAIQHLNNELHDKRFVICKFVICH